MSRVSGGGRRLLFVRRRRRYWGRCVQVSPGGHERAPMRAPRCKRRGPGRHSRATRRVESPFPAPFCLGREAGTQPFPKARRALGRLLLFSGAAARPRAQRGLGALWLITVPPMSTLSAGRRWWPKRVPRRVQKKEQTRVQKRAPHDVARSRGSTRPRTRSCCRGVVDAGLMVARASSPRHSTSSLACDRTDLFATWRDTP